VEAGKKAAGEVLALQKRVLAVLNEARYGVTCLKISGFSVLGARNIFEIHKCVIDSWIWLVLGRVLISDKGRD
jgi:hypothetical protein